ncbi:MAG: inorganic phosphate transporter [Syntrophales bacterium]|nr:inorganic phosphate transporter [Syntrophales bacterium]
MSYLIILIIVALIFDFINGFHDAANSISTIVSTRVLSPRYAVIWAAFFNFAAIAIAGTPVAKTIGTGIIRPEIIDNNIIFSALAGAIIWNLITWAYGLPSSSSHALIGGLIGAGVMKSGIDVLVWSGFLKTFSFIFISPLIGLILGFTLMVITLNLSRNSNIAQSTKRFRKLQLVSAAIYSLGHGMNDAQKTMGVIAAVLFSEGLIGPVFHIPYWVEFICYTTIALGTMFGGWRIVKTMGTKITKLQPIGGFCAETAAAFSIIGASIGGIPVSTTHTIAGAIMGVGATKRLTAVRWGVAGKLLWAWILTIPLSATIAAVIFAIISSIQL